jgi:hypothetical protein
MLLGRSKNCKLVKGNSALPIASPAAKSPNYEPAPRCLQRPSPHRHRLWPPNVFRKVAAGTRMRQPGTQHLPQERLSHQMPALRPDWLLPPVASPPCSLDHLVSATHRQQCPSVRGQLIADIDLALAEYAATLPEANCFAIDLPSLPTNWILARTHEGGHVTLAIRRICFREAAHVLFEAQNHFNRLLVLARFLQLRLQHPCDRATTA